MSYRGTIRSTIEPLKRDVIQRIDSTLANFDPSYVGFTYVGDSKVMVESLGYNPRVLDIDSIMAVSKRHKI